MRTVMLSVLGASMVTIVAYGVGHWTANDGPSRTTRAAATAEPGADQRHGSTLDSAAASQLIAMQRALRAAASASARTEDPEAAPLRADDAPTNAPATETPELTDEEAEAREKQRLEAWYQGLEDRFATQTVDGTFRRETEGRIRDALTNIGSDSAKVESIECRSDTCKTTLRHDSPQIDRTFMLGVVTRTPQGFEQHYRYEQGRTVVYTIRQEKRRERRAPE